MSKKIVGIDYTAALHQQAGIGRYTRELVRAIARANAGYQYRLFVAEAQKVRLPAAPGSEFEWSPSRLTERWLGRLWYRLQLPLPVNLWTGPVDLFHQPDFFLPPVKRSTRTLVTVHDLSFVREQGSIMPGMSAKLNKWVPRSVQRANHVIAVSEATRRDLIELYQTPPEKISVLYHGVTSEFQPIRDPDKLAAVRRKYNLGDDPFILSVGTLQPRKNHQRLIQAFARLKGSLSLVIAGSKGWDWQAIIEEADRQRLSDRVHFPGFIEDADLPALYSAATLFVYPSLYEGFGLPVLEAMACGTAVIAANASALPEVVSLAGQLVDPEDVPALATAMAHLIEDDTARERLVEAGQKRAALFSWPKMAGQLLELYQKILETE